MAYFAQIDQNNIVTHIVVVNDDVILNSNQIPSEELGIEYCKTIFGNDTKWKQTFIDGQFRVRYAGIGYLYNQDLDAFISPKPYSSWTLNESTLEWDPPFPPPDEENHYVWNEDTQQWDKVILPSLNR